ncbi:acetylxylan esterase [Actinospica robiniae]|uniref:acetylxylan esterase n=1 Tax=Actinospica robiniae TaxID=304901 RepID=UPI000417DFD6|nr:acetylxylan esterase [Actinospica robiniae]
MKISQISPGAAVNEHPFPFDPSYGMDLDALLQVSAPDNAPSDFAEFWSRRYNEARDTTVEPKLGRKVRSARGVEFYEIEFTSVGGVRLGGWLALPADGEVERGFVFGHGYSGRDAPDSVLPVARAAAIFPASRGLPTKGLIPGVPADPGGHVLHGVESPATYIVGGCVADLWCAATALTELVPAAGRRLDYSGISFGGGTGALALPWDDRFTAAQLIVPTFGNHPLRVTLECNGSGAAVRERFLTDPAVLDVLAYFDAATAARHLRLPVHAVPALFDPSVPPPSQFAIVNSLAGPVEALVATAGHFHEFPQYTQETVRLVRATREFFAA